MKQTQNTLTLIVWIILVVAIIFAYFKPVVVAIPLKKSFIYFPYEIGQWSGEEKVTSDFTSFALAPDDLLIRNYKRKDGEKCELYMAYFQHTGENKAPHPPQACWLGSGWSLKDVGTDFIKLASLKNSNVVIKKIVAEKEGERILLLYCYKMNEKYATDFSLFRYMSVLDSIFKRKSSAFTIQLSTTMGNEDMDKKHKVMEDFMSKVLTILEDEFLP